MLRTVVSLRSFLFNSDFGGITPDATREEVVRLFGLPAQKRDDNNGLVLFHYGWFELAFFDQNVCYIGVESLHEGFDATRFQCNQIEIRPWVFRNRSPIGRSELLAALKNENASFSDIEVVLPKRFGLKMESGVVIDFSTCEGQFCSSLALNLFS